MAASCVLFYDCTGDRVLFICQANIYRALDPKDATPLPITIKKSRVSQRIQRPRLQHEFRILCALEGHPAIPRVIAYGHLQHFEYLAMELLGKSLDQVMPKDGMDERTVAKIAVQLVHSFNFTWTISNLRVNLLSDSFLYSNISLAWYNTS